MRLDQSAGVIEQRDGEDQHQSVAADCANDRRGRPIQKPSLQRVLKRTAIFAPLIAVFILITADGLTIAGLIFNVVLLLAFFMPFSYVVDTFVYRMLLRRHEKDRAERRAR